MTKKERKLPEYLCFQISISDTRGIEFQDLFGSRLPDWKGRLSPSQWKKASRYLDRRLVPFAGYSYSVKDGVATGVYKII